MRKWTKSACAVAALGIAFLMAVVGCAGSALPARANARIASSTTSVLAGAPVSLTAGPAAPAAAVFPVVGPQAAGIMPRWLKGTLLAVALLTVIAFITLPTVAIRQRRSRGLREQAAARKRLRERRAAKKMARVVQADHERLIVTYSVSDDTVYLLTPPGEDPRTVLRAARLVLPEDTYEELAGHLGVPPGWQRE